MADIYAPGTEETDPKKQNMALQQIAEKAATAIDDIATNSADIATNSADIATNTADIATNTADIATNAADIAALETSVAALPFPSGTLMLFQQTSAPTGWTKQTTHNDKALRVVSGTASSGGTNAFSTVMAQTVVGSTALVLNQIPPHTHGYNDSSIAGGGIIGLAAGGQLNGDVARTTGSTGGSGGVALGHDHTITMAMQYVDLIIASKDA